MQIVTFPAHFYKGFEVVACGKLLLHLNAFNALYIVKKFEQYPLGLVGRIKTITETISLIITVDKPRSIVTKQDRLEIKYTFSINGSRGMAY